MSYQFNRLKPRSWSRRLEFVDEGELEPKRLPSWMTGCVIPVLVFSLTVSLSVVAFPPIDFAEAAYLFAVPLITWSFYRPSYRIFLGTSAIAGFASWLILIWWLRHVTYLGTVALSGFLTLYLVGWTLVVRMILPRIEGRGFSVRLPVLLGLAGFWVLLEYMRGFLLTGFPWLPLAASQWDRGAVLQIAAYTGYTGVSFILIFFNLGLGVYLRRILTRRRAEEWYERICPEFYVALFLLVGTASGLIWSEVFNQRQERLFSVTVVQPYIEQPSKWDPEKTMDIFRTLEKQTLFANGLGGEVIFWPESVTPLPVKGNHLAREWTEELVRRIDKPIVMGNIAKEDKFWYNIVCAVTPDEGLIEPYYIKRKLVPFGEYVPFGGFLSFIDKIVPIAGSFRRGEEAVIIPVKIGNSTYRIGALVCYEDIFSRLSRENVKAGADLIFVATNDAWYGEEGGAYQHAAHSVLRAVETRRPFIRCGNSGWSGWIDEYGNVRKVLVVPEKGIYFRGSELFELKRDAKWFRRESFYVMYGDWFISVCLGLSVWGYVCFRFVRDTRYRLGSSLRGKGD